MGVRIKFLRKLFFSQIMIDLVNRETGNSSLSEFDGMLDKNLQPLHKSLILFF